jgi:hypothetical protein
MRGDGSDWQRESESNIYETVNKQKTYAADKAGESLKTNETIQQEK